MEDALTDILASACIGNPLTSLADTKTFVKAQVPKLVSGHTALLLSGAVDRITSKLVLFFVGRPAPRDGKLGKLVRDVKLSDKYKVPLVQLNLINGVTRITVRIPAIAESDTASMAAFESIMTLLHYTTGVKPENMFYVADKELGTTIHLDQVLIKLIDELTSSASLPSGAFPGEIVSFGEYKGNTPTILATLHLLARKQFYLRRRDPQRKEKVICVTSQELRSSFNLRAGLTDKSKSYGSMLMKSALAVIVSTTNRVFPGGWISSNRMINKVKSDSGLIFKLGYCEKIPYHHKLMAVIHNTVTTSPNGSSKVLTQSGQEFKNYSFLEFRAGAVLTAPKLISSSEEEFTLQAKREPLNFKVESVVDNFTDNKYHKVINSLNRAHALLVTCNKGNSKTKPIHYEIARNEFLHLSAKAPIRDGLSGEYTHLSELPKPVYEHCRKLFRFKKYESKRDVDQMETDDQHQTENDPKESSSSKQPAPPLKRNKTVRRPETSQVAEGTRSKKTWGPTTSDLGQTK
jgi:hypothetical protein